MKIGILTAGGLAPCLSASIGKLISTYYKKIPNIQIIGYLHGYKGLLTGKSIAISDKVKRNAEVLDNFGGSPIGNSRVKLTNIQDCVEKGYVQKNQNPLQVASDQLLKDGVNILHTIGGDDTNTMAAELSRYLSINQNQLIVVGLPKTVDNDVYPIHQSLGAWTAAEEGAKFFENISNETTTSSRQLIIHEIMGRNCGWLTAATAEIYLKRLQKREFLPEIGITKEKWGIDAIYIPEISINIPDEIRRLKSVMDQKDSVTIFLSEGAGVESIVKELESEGKTIEKDSFGHYRLDQINPGKWFGKQFARHLDADKVLVQKSGYFSRSAAPNKMDLDLIQQSASMAVDCALKGISGVIGLDEDYNNQLTCIDFKRIRGGKPFDYKVEWFAKILSDIGQING